MDECIVQKIWKINKRVADATKPLMKKVLDPLQKINYGRSGSEKW
jgi:hypothetical protein